MLNTHKKSARVYTDDYMMLFKQHQAKHSIEFAHSTGKNCHYAAKKPDRRHDGMGWVCKWMKTRYRTRHESTELNSGQSDTLANGAGQYFSGCEWFLFVWLAPHWLSWAANTSQSEQRSFLRSENLMHSLTNQSGICWHTYYVHRISQARPLVNYFQHPFIYSVL